MTCAAPRVLNRRRAELARIHILAEQIGLTREQYEAVLMTVARVDSAALLDTHGRAEVIRHLENQLRRHQPGSTAMHYRSRPQVSADRAPLVGKIRALLVSATPPREDAYADAMAKHMFGVTRYTWCTPPQLSKLVAALAIDAKRRERTAVK
ncbi:MAG: regulatory protein GemA [Sinobacteraceae bacterium]|nr:regulatory protein GemA [Nevskiaceae bacterium]